LGNRDAYDLHGKTNFINKLNELFYEYARNHEKFYIHDINYLSARYGLDDWSDSFYWHMYKYAPSVPAIPELAHSVANIIKSICGKNKKAFAMDLDNTIGGGVVGDDGVDALEIGQETAIGQAYDEFGQYLKAHKDLGILLTVSSKNEEENAIAGLNHPDFVLNPEDFVTIKANWNPKSENIKQIADELNLLPESFVFVDDNPAERELVRGQLSGIAVPEIESVENYIKIVDHSGYFEITDFTEDDKHRTKMYQTENARKQLQQKFVNYNEYLISLEMHASIGPFQQLHMTRIAQLTNKSNQFNLTTKRFTAHELESVAESDEYIDLSGQLSDKFGDNGVVSVVVGRIDESLLHLELWLMSCRVLKRDMELAMLDSLVGCALECGINKIIGYYYPTKKNGIVKDFYEDLGFQKIDEDEQGNTKWSYDTKTHERKNYVIEVEIQ
jgi:FkbH-like protein